MSGKSDEQKAKLLSKFEEKYQHLQNLRNTYTNLVKENLGSIAPLKNKINTLRDALHSSDDKNWNNNFDEAMNAIEVEIQNLDDEIAVPKTLPKT